MVRPLHPGTHTAGPHGFLSCGICRTSLTHNQSHRAAPGRSRRCRPLQTLRPLSLRLALLSHRWGNQVLDTAGCSPVTQRGCGLKTELGEANDSSSLPSYSPSRRILPGAVSPWVGSATLLKPPAWSVAKQAGLGTGSPLGPCGLMAHPVPGFLSVSRCSYPEEGSKTCQSQKPHGPRPGWGARLSMCQAARLSGRHTLFFGCEFL